ncbi:SRPBCC family protein [Tahibacter amnicola]|uniref:SRPBCC family protein n=1 Tax=Tahibacter amnicola TaxID=2976241 RepID=A0ABY6BLL3_9GAMM|nr:SRPBCC family protein [Tahibacter amnicola]UXI69461.1 SRPBCC family protein [Tahibacter amnicola]
MPVINVHERVLAAPLDAVGGLIDTLASADDRLWPRAQWMPMRLSAPLGEGAAGGHGPVRYRVEHYEPSRAVRFRFEGPRGFDGWHGLDVAAINATATRLRHVLQMRPQGLARLSWPLFFRPLHDALLEDALACAERALGLPVRVVPWTRQVCVLRWIAGRGKTPPQMSGSIAAPGA